MKTLSHRVATLEDRLGPAWDDNNPAGFAAVLAADERAQMLDAGETLLDAYGLNAAFVPHRHGGWLTTLDGTISLLRSVFRRDPALGLGYGASSFIAAVNVWAAGSEVQQRNVAELLLRNGKLACAYHELEHGNDVAQADFLALPEGDNLRLCGKKQVISNVQRAEAMVIFARTSFGPGNRHHSQVLVDKKCLDPDAVSYRERFKTSGMRGVQLGGIEIRDGRVPADAVLGVPGRGLEVALTSFQLTRIALPGMFLGILDTGLRVATRFAFGRTLYGRSVADLPLVRAALAETFADILLCDAFVSVAARSVHALPGEVSLCSAAVKALVPEVLKGAMNRLSAILGAQFYLRTGEHAIFQKLLRDLQPVGFGHASRASCILSLLPQLPLLARRAWGSPEEAPARIFQLQSDEAGEPFCGLSVSARGEDRLTSALLTGYESWGQEGAVSSELARVLRAFVEAFVELKRAVGELRPSDVTVAAGPRAFALASQYALLMAASACINLWWHNRNAQEPFVSEETWLLAVLGRIASRLGLQCTVSSDVRSQMFQALSARYREGRSFDLSNAVLSGYIA